MKLEGLNYLNNKKLMFTNKTKYINYMAFN